MMIKKLHFYNFDIPTISVGATQNTKNISDDINIERRFTNGNALYVHNSEVIFDLVIESNLKPSEILYNVQNTLQKSLNKICDNVTIANDTSKDKYKSVECFNSVGKYELLYNNKKLMGSAISIKNGIYYQQSILYIEPTYKKLKDYVKDKIDYSNRCISISEIGIITKKDDIISIIKEGFSNEWNFKS